MFCYLVPVLGKNIDWRWIVQRNLQVPTVSHIDYYKLIFNNLSSSDKWQCCIYSLWHWYHQFHYIPLLSLRQFRHIPLLFLHLQQQPNETIQQNRSTWQLLTTTCTSYFYLWAWLATIVLSGSGRIVKFTIRYIPNQYHTLTTYSRKRGSVSQVFAQ